MKLREVRLMLGREDYRSVGASLKRMHKNGWTQVLPRYALGLSVCCGSTEFASRIYGQIIVTSYLFPDGKFSLERLQKVSSVVGKDRLVVDVRYARREPLVDMGSDCVQAAERGETGGSSQ